ncbi:hypothetical protein F2Q69_00046257 [Brassica cretica]|uniref:Uncharacterized protein n=1 Tax=Brassica cretica TaxID=69181 RepID=A0A8S9PWT4_BRACR|nr:hypothetical protein F2Q69_00046257 [Brassica cretica]
MILSICCLIPEPPRQQLTPFDLTKKKKKTFVVQDAIEDSAESHGRHTIRCLIVQEEFIGYIAEHPNDEEEVEGIDLHQQRYPWEGSDMDYLYDESSFAQLLSMELTLEIDGAIIHVPIANASSNVDSQLQHAKITMQWVFEITKLAMYQDIKSISADG